MGIVYRAWQRSADREVALMCLTLENEDAQTRFATEIRALGKVIHPNLVRVYTSGVDDDRFYYAMELIDGTGFRQLLGQLPSDTQLTPGTWRDAVSSASDTSLENGGSLSRSDAWSESLAEANDAANETTSVVNEAYRSREYVHPITAIIRDIADATAALHEAGQHHAAP